MRTIVFFDRALKIDLNWVPALFNKGICLEKLGNHEDAQELFDRAKQLDPTYKLFDGAKQLEPQI
ncbi:MAG TPA: tetratricopeptide repeat protein [Nitrososphaeraceae archaeon]